MKSVTRFVFSKKFCSIVFGPLSFLCNLLRNCSSFVCRVFSFDRFFLKVFPHDVAEDFEFRATF